MAEKNDRLNCSICLNDFKKPKILDCFHSFCESCLSDYVSKYEENGEFMCPMCRRNIPIPSGGVKDLASNVYIEERQSIDQPESNPPCNICDKDIQSQFRCKDCDKFLCGSCKTTHDLFVSDLNHYVISLDEDAPDDVKAMRHVICQHHKKKFAVYCSDCSKVICSKCSKKEHEHHTIINNDDTDQVIKAAKDSLEKLKKDIDRQIQGLCDCRDVVKTSSSNLHESITSACKLVDQQVTAICETVKYHGEKIKHDINKSKVDEYKLNQMHEELITIIDELKTGNGELSEDLTTCDSVDLLDGFPDLRKRLTVIEKKPFYIPEFKLPSIKLGDVDEQVLRNTIGQVEYTQRQSIQHNVSLICSGGKTSLVPNILKPQAFTKPESCSSSRPVSLDPGMSLGVENETIIPIPDESTDFTLPKPRSRCQPALSSYDDPPLTPSRQLINTRRSSQRQRSLNGTISEREFAIPGKRVRGMTPSQPPEY